MANPTPGPWAFDHDWHRLPTIFGADGVTKVAVAEKVSGSLHTPEQEANARLITAAPDLLDELDCRIGDLVMLRKAIDAGDPKRELLVRIDDMLRETRAAISKATSRQPEGER